MAFDEALREIEQMVSGAGGYIESQSVDGRSIRYQGDYYERYASITARVPSGKLDSLTATLGTLCNIVSQSEQRDDITDTYYDAQARLDSLNIQEQTLLDILEKAEKLEDVIELQKALADVRYQIESITASLKRMDSQVTYSYLNLSLREVVEYQEAISKPKTFGEKFSLALSRGGEHFVNSTQGFVLALAEGLPTLLLWVVIIGGVALLVRALLRRLRRRRDAKEQALRESADRARREREELDARLNPDRGDEPKE